MPTNSRVPSLRTLAATAVEKTNPNQFFQLSSFTLPKEIQQNFVDKQISAVTTSAIADYTEARQDRENKVENCSNQLSSVKCFSKVTGCSISLLMTSLHVGIYFILKAVEADPQATGIFICTIPATFLISACVGTCLTPVVAKGIASCIHPSPSSNITIDLNELEKAQVTPIL